MKKMSLVALLALSTLAWAQKIDKPTNAKNSSDKALLVKSDAAELEAKKKAAAEEKAKMPKPYDAKADAQADINKLIAQAQKEGKNIMIQAGGNWCIWCLRFNQYVQTTPELKKIVDKNYLYYHLNYSPDNKNEKVFGQYINLNEQQFYPFFIILDQNGKKIHIQQSDVLEDGKGYNLEKVKNFLTQWAKKNPF